jgi:hypothetical protein
MINYQLLIFLCIILCINSNFTTTTDILVEDNEPVSNQEKNVMKIITTTNSMEASSKEPFTKDTKKISNDTFESKKQGAINIIQNLDPEQLEILVKIIDDYHKSESTILKKSTITTTTYSLATLAIPSSTSKTTTTTIFSSPIAITSDSSTTSLVTDKLKETQQANSTNTVYLYICIAVFSVLILTLIGIIIHMIIINDLKIVLCGKIIRERTKTKQIKV